ncbi:hypothetical protein ABZ671_31685 [Micromonospora sp. NPDC006766]|uniref:hypothetical protein n=1 Tax=Micromonospora sp. NPDC006766 TaxID=3154778 RepID=UPI003409E60B
MVVHGIAGIGKTALALTAAHTLATDYPDGCLFADLASYGDNEPVPTTQVLDTFLRILGLDGDAIPADEHHRVALYRSVLSGRRLLVVLDNARQSRQVKPLIPGTHGCAVLITSRNSLPALDADAVVPVGPLAASAALRVLGAEPEAPSPDVMKVADACAGHPLALRIAAALLDGNPPATAAELAARLSTADRPAEVLQDDERRLADTLSAALISLSALDGTTIAHLALHPGPALAATAAGWLLQQPAERVATDLARLHRSGLLTSDSHARYGFHDLLAPLARDLAGRRMELGPRDAGLRRLVAGYLHAVRAASVTLSPYRFQPAPAADPPAGPLAFDSRAAAVAWCFTELDNIVALIKLTFERHWNAACWQLAYWMRDYFFLSKTLDRWIFTHRLAVEAAERDADLWAQAVSHNNLGLGLVEIGDVDTGMTHFRRAMRTFGDLGDTLGQAVTYGHQAWANYCLAQYVLAQRQVARAVSLYQQHGDQRGCAINLRTLGLINMNIPGADAEAPLLRSLRVFADLELPLDQAMALNCLGELHLARGSHRKAARSFADAVRTARNCLSEQEHARGLAGLADVATASGHDWIGQMLRHAAQCVETQPQPAESAQLIGSR